jgi:hypothetical protein
MQRSASTRDDQATSSILGFFSRIKLLSVETLISQTPDRASESAQIIRGNDRGILSAAHLNIQTVLNWEHDKL